MNSTELLKTELSKFKWTLPILSNPVKQKMMETLKLDTNSTADDYSFTFLSTNIYKPGGILTKIPSIKPISLQTITSSFPESTYLNQQIKQLYKEGALADSSIISNNVNKWIQDFLQFCLVKTDYKNLSSFLEYAIILKDVNFRGASHPHFLSSIFLKNSPEDTKFDFLVSIIHETAHQELFLINFVDRLINAKYDFNLIHAPYQNKTRPPIGRLHSLHALFRMIQFSNLYEITNPKNLFFITKFRENLMSFGHEELTEFSQYLLKEVYEPFSKSL